MISRRPRKPLFSADAAGGTLGRIGGELRAARLARREDLYDIADVLRIRPVYLEGLESGDLDVMPGRPYALGFLKSYADYLGLDGRALADQAKGIDGAVRPGPTLVYRTPVDEKRRPTKVLAAVSIVVAVLVYAGWHGYSSGRIELNERISALPLQIGEVAVDLVAGDMPPPPLVGTAAVIPVGSAPAASAPLAAATAAVSLDELRLVAPDVAPEPGAAMAAARPAAADAASAQAAERLPTESLPVAEAVSAGAMLAALDDTASAGSARTFGAGGDGGRVLLIARESSWVQVRSRGRDYVRTRTLEAGDRMFLPNRNDLSLWTGNAGGVELQVDGRSVGVLGRRGDVLREVSLEPEGLLRRAAMR